jgi:hypothetical protein
VTPSPGNVAAASSGLSCQGAVCNETPLNTTHRPDDGFRYSRFGGFTSVDHPTIAAAVLTVNVFGVIRDFGFAMNVGVIVETTTTAPEVRGAE